MGKGRKENRKRKCDVFALQPLSIFSHFRMTTTATPTLRPVVSSARGAGYLLVEEAKEEAEPKAG